MAVDGVGSGPSFSGWRPMARDGSLSTPKRPTRCRAPLSLAPVTRIISASFPSPGLSRDQRNLAPYMARFDHFVGLCRLAKRERVLDVDFELTRFVELGQRPQTGG